MIPITKQQEKDIYKCFKHGLKRPLIRRMFNITDNELMAIVKRAIDRENKIKNK